MLSAVNFHIQNVQKIRTKFEASFPDPEIKQLFPTILLFC
jgi:hypothetical protein